MKKVFKSLLSLCLLSSLVACSNQSNGFISSTNQNDELNVAELSIDDFAMGFENKLNHGERSNVFTFTDNSNLIVKKTLMKYKFKDDVTEEDLKVLDDFKKDHENYIDENDELYIVAGFEDFLTPNQLLDGDIEIGTGKYRSWRYKVTNDMINLTEPDYIMLELIKNNKFYTTYYDFLNNKWQVELDKDKELNNWYENEVSALISKPDWPYYQVTSNPKNTSYFDFDGYQLTKKDFDDYVELLKSNGFNQDDSIFETNVHLSNENGDTITVSYPSYYNNVIKVSLHRK